MDSVMSPEKKQSSYNLEIYFSKISKNDILKSSIGSTKLLQNFIFVVSVIFLSTAFVL